MLNELFRNSGKAFIGTEGDRSIQCGRVIKGFQVLLPHINETHISLFNVFILDIIIEEGLAGLRDYNALLDAFLLVETGGEGCAWKAGGK